MKLTEIFWDFSELFNLSVQLFRSEFPAGSSALIGLTALVCVTCWQLSEAQVLHGSGGDQRFLRVVQHMSQCVHSYVEVGDVDAHGLFTHSRLVRVSGRLKKNKQNFNMSLRKVLI